MKKSKRQFVVFLGIVVLAVLLAGSRAAAQSVQVTLEGFITDDEGSPLPGATVVARNVETGYTKSTDSRSDGSYIISGLQPGEYEMEISLAGFATQLRKGMTFSIGARVKLDFKLALATVEEVITVTGKAPMVEVTRSEVSKVVDREKIDSLPLYDRNFTALTIMKAGVQAEGDRSNAQPFGSEEMLTDGISNEWVGRNTVRSDIPADAIQEFRVLTNQYEAEYGNASGMIRSAITRSGTNTWQGRLAFFYRDELFDDANYFIKHDEYKGPEVDYEKPPYTRFNWAGHLGGPIVEDKLQFFVAYEGFRNETSTTTNIPGIEKETFPTFNRNNQILAKVNYQLSEKHLFTFRYSLNRPVDDDTGAGGSFGKSMAYDYTDRTHEFQFNWTYYPSDNTMNEVRILFSDNKYSAEVPDPNAYSIFRPSGYFGKYPNLPQEVGEKRYQFVDNFSIFAGDHRIKFGIDASVVTIGGDLWQYYPGVYQFGTNAPFDPTNFLTYPLLLITSPKIALVDMDYSDIGLFVQDSWIVTPRLTLNYGLRYNYYTCTDMDINNFGLLSFNPRFGFSYDPVGDGKSVIRGGIGLYSQNPQANIGLLIGLMNSLDVKYYFYPGYPDPDIPNPFIPAIPYEPPLTTYSGKENLVPATTMQVTLGYQREFVTDLSLGFDLIWAKGHKFTRFEDYNAVIPGTSVIRPDMTKGSEWVIVDAGKSDYKAFYLTLTKRYSHGWSLDISYALGRSWSDVEMEQNMPYDNEEDNWVRMYGPNNEDATHRFAMTGVVDLPLNFQLSGIVLYRSAVPYTAFYEGDVNKDGTATDMVDKHRNARRGFSQFWLNFRLSYYLRFSRVRLQFFAEGYNITNAPNFLEVHNVYETEAFGNPIEAYDPRRFQFGVRLDF